MLAITAAKMVHSEIPIFYDTSKHFNWCLVNNARNASFEFLYSNWLGHVGFAPYVVQKEKD